MKLLNFEQFLNEAFVFGDYPAHRPYGDKTPEDEKQKKNDMTEKEWAVLAKLNERYPDMRFSADATFEVTEEEYEYAIARSKTFSDRQRTDNGNLKKNAVNGLIAEVTIAHRLYEKGYVDEWQDEDMTIHESDGGVDIPLYDFKAKEVVPCDVKCCTFKNGELTGDTQISVYKMGQYAKQDLKHSFYIICTGYVEDQGPYGTVYLIGVVETGTFINTAAGNKQVDTVENGYRYWIQCNQVINLRDRVSSLKQLFYYSVPWKPYFKKYVDQLAKQDAKKARRLAKYKAYYDSLKDKGVEPENN